MNETRLILASQSKIRRHILENAGVKFEAIASNVDEEMAKIALRETDLKPSEQAHELAKLKAQKLSNRFPDAYIIACDQMLALDGEVFDKATDMVEARARLTHFRGKTHYLQNAMVIYKGGEFIWRYDCAPKLKMRAFSDDFLDNYLEQTGDKILSSVGCYQLEGLGVQLFDEISGDYFAILGLPLLPLLTFLRNHNIIQS